MLPGLVVSPTNLVDSIDHGDVALAAGRPAEAVMFYRRAAAYPQGEPAVVLKIAQAELELAREGTGDPKSGYQAARDAWLDALAINGLNSSIGSALAEAYLALGEIETAHEWAMASIGTPGSSAIWQQLAQVHLVNANWNLAGQAYSAIAASEPDNSEAHFWAGALLMNSDIPQARYHLLQVRAATTSSQPAEKLLAVLDELEGASDSAYRAAQLGLAYLNIDEPGLARHHLQTAVDLEPTFTEAWAYLGLAQDRFGEDGRRAIAHAVELEPENPLAHSLMGHHWLRYNQFALARQAFVAAWELDPENPIRMVDVASAYSIAGDFYSAKAWYQAAIRLAPEDVTLWVILARFHLDTLNDVADGLLAAQRSVALAPEDPSALDALGWAQFLMGELRLAEVNLQGAWDRDPLDPVIGYHLGRLYESLGDRGKAEAFYREVVSLDTACRLCPVPRLGSLARLAEVALREMGG
jgi:tetratricopeptide (TPR) repeat protein